MSTIVVSLGSDYSHAQVERREFPDFVQFAEFIREGQSEGHRTGPYICAPMINGHRNSEDAQPTSVLALDFDELSPEALRKLCVAIAEAGWKAVLWTTRRSTPDAPRVRIVFELDRSVTKPEYASVYRAVVRHLAEATCMPLVADSSCARPEQAAVLPQPASTLWMRTEGTALSVDAYLAFDPGTGADESDHRAGDTHAHPDSGKVREGSRNEHLSKLAFKFRKAGASVEEITAALQVANTRRCDPPLPLDEVQAIAKGKATIEPEKNNEVALLAFDVDELLQPAPAPRYLIPGLIPTEAYTIAAGALSAGKTTMVLSMMVWRATGYDILDLDLEGRLQPEVGPCVFVTYEDPDSVIEWRIKTIVQGAHERILMTHGMRAAQEFLQRFARNFRRITLTGVPGSMLVARGVNGNVGPNIGQIDELLAMIGRFADRELLLAIDPLRLAFHGSQNDDQGADVIVTTLNHLGSRFPDSGLIVASHTTKASAIEGTQGRMAAAYATSGSALYSQHARSNFHIGRPPAAKLRDLAPDFLTDEDIEKERVTALTHARLSYGPEAVTAHFVFRGGVLVPVPVQTRENPVERLARQLVEVAAALDQIVEIGGKPSKSVLESDFNLRRHHSRKEIREMVHDLIGQDWLEIEGKGPAARVRVTPSGRSKISPFHSAR